MYQISPSNWMIIFIYMINMFSYMYMYMNNFEINFYQNKKSIKIIYVK